MKDTTFAKALKSFIGIGEYLGKKEEDTELSEEDLIKLLQEELKKDQSLNDIAKNISDTTGLRKNYLYKLLVKIKNDL